MGAYSYWLVSENISSLIQIILFIATYYDHLEIVKFLVRKCCNIEKELNTGATSLVLGI